MIKALIAILWILCCLFTSIKIANCQNDSKLSEYLPEYSTEDPSALYNGVPNISIPLYAIKGKGISVPVALTYDASGITVQQEATSAGLGWTLNAGGYIVHETKDWYDFAGVARAKSDTMAGYLQKFRYGTTSYWTGSGDYEFLSKYDNLPDMFYYNCNGISGKFFLSDDHTSGITLPSSTVEIKFDTSSADILITADNGIMYQFDLVQNICPSGNYIKTESMIFVLKTIYTPQYDTIEFTYQSVYYEKPVYQSIYDEINEEFFHTIVDETMPINLLKSVSINNGESIEVEYGEKREDVRAIPPDSVPVINRIKLLDADCNTKKYFELYHSYFISEPYLQYFPKGRYAEGSYPLAEGSYNLKDGQGGFIMYDSVAFAGEWVEEEIPAYGYRNGLGETISNHFSRGLYLFTRNNDTVYAIFNDEYLHNWFIPDLMDVFDFEYIPELCGGCSYEEAYEDYLNAVYSYNQQLEEYSESVNSNTTFYQTTKTEGGMQYFAVDTSYMEELADYFGDPCSRDFRPFYHSRCRSKRLRLDSIREYSGDSEEYCPSITFKYNEETNLPHYFSSDFDHWGYYNYREGKPNLSPVNEDLSCESVFDVCDGTTDGSIFPYNGNRSPNEEKMKANILEKINYPNGGYINYEFEANRARSNASGTESEVVGGLRLKKTERGIGAGEKYFTTYDYKEFRDTVINGLHYLDTTGICSGYLHAENVQYKKGIGRKPVNDPLHGWMWEIVKLGVEKSQRPLIKTRGGYVGYSSVAVKKEDNSGNDLGTSLFRFHANEPVEYVPVTRVYGSDDFTDFMQYIGPPKPSSPYLGTLEEMITADRWGRIQSRTINEYCEVDPDLRELEDLSYYSKYIHSYAGTLGEYGLYRSFIDPSESVMTSLIHLHYVVPTLAIKSGSYKFRYDMDGGIFSDSVFYLYDIPQSQVLTSDFLEDVGDLSQTYIETTEYDSILDAYYYAGQNCNIYSYECYHTHQPILKLKLTSSGDTLRTRFWYPPHLAAPDTVFKKMVQRNIISPVIKSEKFLNGERIGGQRISYEVFDGDTIGDEDFILPSKTDSYFKNNYETVQEVISYDNYGFPVESIITDGNVTSTIRGYNNSKTVAVIENANLSEIRYLDFEEDRYQDWEAINNGGTVSSAVCNTGIKTLRTESSGFDGIQHTISADDLDTDGQYRFSARFKNIDYTTTSPPCIRVVVHHSGGSTQLNKYSSNTNLWNEVELTVDLSGYSNISAITLYTMNGAPGQSADDYGLVYMDGVKFYPSDAMMVTYTYDPLFGITSETDSQGMTVIYRYDKLGRLCQSLDQNGTILKQLQYHYKGQ